MVWDLLAIPIPLRGAGVGPQQPFDMFIKQPKIMNGEGGQALTWDIFRILECVESCMVRSAQAENILSTKQPRVKISTSTAYILKFRI